VQSKRILEAIKLTIYFDHDLDHDHSWRSGLMKQGKQYVFACTSCHLEHRLAAMRMKIDIGIKRVRGTTVRYLGSSSGGGSVGTVGIR